MEGVNYMTDKVKRRQMKQEKRANELLEAESDNFLFNYDEKEANDELKHLNRIARELGVKV
jgi:hypothetical protein